MKTALLAPALVALALTASCNTVRGAAQDVQAGGAAVEDAATSIQTEIQADQSQREAKAERDATVANTPN
jgi:predicted small secreted protein